MRQWRASSAILRPGRRSFSKESRPLAGRALCRPDDSTPCAGAPASGDAPTEDKADDGDDPHKATPPSECDSNLNSLLTQKGFLSNNQLDSLASALATAVLRDPSILGPAALPPPRILAPSVPGRSMVDATFLDSRSLWRETGRQEVPLPWHDGDDPAQEEYLARQFERASSSEDLDDPDSDLHPDSDMPELEAYPGRMTGPVSLSGFRRQLRTREVMAVEQRTPMSHALTLPLHSPARPPGAAPPPPLNILFERFHRMLLNVEHTHPHAMDNSSKAMELQQLAARRELKNNQIFRRTPSVFRSSERFVWWWDAPRPPGQKFHQKMLIPADRLIIRMAESLCLSFGPEFMDAALETLGQLEPVIRQISGGNSVNILLGHLDAVTVDSFIDPHIPKDYSNARAIYATVPATHPLNETIYRIARLIAYELYRSGLLPSPDPGELRMTLARVPRRQSSSGDYKSFSFDARPIMRAFGPGTAFELGFFTIASLELTRLHGTPMNPGSLNSELSIPFAKKQPPSISQARLPQLPPDLLPPKDAPANVAPPPATLAASREQDLLFSLATSTLLAPSVPGMVAGHERLITSRWALPDLVPNAPRGLPADRRGLDGAGGGPGAPGVAPPPLGGSPSRSPSAAPADGSFSFYSSPPAAASSSSFPSGRYFDAPLQRALPQNALQSLTQRLPKSPASAPSAISPFASFMPSRPGPKDAPPEVAQPRVLDRAVPTGRSPLLDVMPNLDLLLNSIREVAQQRPLMREKHQNPTHQHLTSLSSLSDEGPEAAEEQDVVNMTMASGLALAPEPPVPSGQPDPPVVAPAPGAPTADRSIDRSVLDAGLRNIGLLPSGTRTGPLSAETRTRPKRRGKSKKREAAAAAAASSGSGSGSGSGSDPTSDPKSGEGGP
ncbi:hypothetical protein H696_02617 [Fonticula alba]|uniref:Uncharacterized protein n=1 Tax=Fonticula alba TaxID=691883 RepID=A0A058Z9S3_FONAL|nr:hypothetical protein H696_02617 [Fonticula alba]KCV70287.1 hypothetical protein H696_02617 [Fonticula alba]|eukprot:XP_009494803.1 hypothetical protein H696_02617 [Fonticula alba]